MRNLFCPLTGIKVVSKSEWKTKITDTKFSSEYSIIGNKIIYCKPSGKADLEGAEKSFAVNKKVMEFLPQNSQPFVQIEDYVDLLGSTSESRKYFLDVMNGNDRLIALIFCNLSTPLSIAVKLGSRFKKDNKTVHIAKDYKEAVRLALDICKKKKIEQYPERNVPNLKIFNNGQSLAPLEFFYDSKLDIVSSKFSNKTVLIDNTILHSQTKGCLSPEYIPLIDKMRQFYQDTLSEGAAIKYIIVDSSELKGGCRKSRFQFIKSLQNWHKKYPINLYLFYSTNIFMRTAVKLARPFVTFKIRVANDIFQGFDIINKDRLNSSSIQVKRKFEKRRKDKFRGDVDRLFTFIGSIDWEKEGFDEDIAIETDSPYYYPFQSIKLIKEELDKLFAERKKSEDELISSFHENKNLYLELQHRVKNSFMLLSSLINLMIDSKSLETEKNILREINTKIHAVSNMYSLLHTSDSINSAPLDEYLGSLIASYDITTVKVMFQTELEHLMVPVSKVVPIGLIVSELVTNSIKHAFKEDSQGIISLTCKSIDNRIKLIYSDNGVGFSKHENDSNSGSMGISLIEALAEQINSELEFENINGMRCTILIED